MQKRTVEYDILRVILTLLVVIGHSTYSTMDFGAGGVAWQLPENASSVYFGVFPFSFLRHVVAWAYSFHMPAFIALSGAVAFLQREKVFARFDDMVIGKARRLLVPYVLAGLFFMLPAKLLGGGYSLQTYPVAIKNFLSLVSDAGHLWFLYALFWCYVLFYPLYKLFYVRYKSVFAVLAVSVFLYLVLSNVPNNFLQWQSGVYNCIWFALGFAFGHFRAMFQGRTKNGDATKHFLGQTPVQIIIAALSAVVGGMNIRCGRFLPLFFAVAVNGCFLFSVSLLLAKIPAFVNSRVLQVLVSYSLFIYLFHDPLNYIILRIAFASNLLTTGWGCYLYAGLRTVGVVLVSLLLGGLVRTVKKRFSRWIAQPSSLQARQG